MNKFNSLQSLRDFLGIKPKKEKALKPIKCRKCGAEMKKIGENVWFCNNPKKNEKGDIIVKNEQPVICGNTHIKSCH